MKQVNLCLSGTAGYFAAQLGATKHLYDLNYRTGNIICTSGGAINGSALALGYNPDDILASYKKIDFKKILDYYFLGYINVLDSKKLALCSGEKIEKELDRFLHVRFKDLDVNLNIVATDLNSKACFIFNKVNTPDELLSFAVRCSLSIPTLFKPIKFRNMLLVDGGLTKNFYLDYFNDNSLETIGVKTFDDNDFDKVTDIKSFLSSMFYTTIYQNELHSIASAKNSKVINLTLDQDPFNFGLTSETIQTYYNSGYTQAKNSKF